MNANKTASIHFYFLKPCHLKDRKKLKAFLLYLFTTEKQTLSSLQYIFCADDFLLKINQDYLNHNYYTDIITFNLSVNQNIDGEVYISVDRVSENARVFGSGKQVELLRVIFHGALHLCGYKDKTHTEKALMTRLENRYLDLYLNEFHVKQ